MTTLLWQPCILWNQCFTTTSGFPHSFRYFNTDSHILIVLLLENRLTNNMCLTHFGYFSKSRSRKDPLKQLNLKDPTSWSATKEYSKVQEPLNSTKDRVLGTGNFQGCCLCILCVVGYVINNLPCSSCAVVKIENKTKLKMRVVFLDNFRNILLLKKLNRADTRKEMQKDEGQGKKG